MVFLQVHNSQVITWFMSVHVSTVNHIYITTISASAYRPTVFVTTQLVPSILLYTSFQLVLIIKRAELNRFQ